MLRHPLLLLSLALCANAYHVLPATRARTPRAAVHACATDPPAAPPPKPPPTCRPLTWDDVEIPFSRSGGSGGQNVNKVNTQATLRLDLSDGSFASGWMDADVRAALLKPGRVRVPHMSPKPKPNPKQKRKQ